MMRTLSLSLSLSLLTRAKQKKCVRLRDVFPTTELLFFEFRVSIQNPKHEKRAFLEKGDDATLLVKSSCEIFDTHII